MSVIFIRERDPADVRAKLPPLSPRQMLLGLATIGITEADVEAGLGDDALALIEWRKASQFERLHPLVVEMGDYFELPPEQIDSLWLYALDL